MAVRTQSIAVSPAPTTTTRLPATSMGAQSNGTGVVFCSRKGKACRTPRNSAPGTSSAPRLPRIKPEKDRVKLPPQFAERQALIELHPKLEDHPSLLQYVNAALDDGTLHLEGRRPIHQQPARHERTSQRW